MAVLKIAKSGGNIIDDADKDLAFTSEKSCLIEMFSGVVELTTDGDGNGSVEVTHNLGYIPAFYTYEKGYFDTTNWYPPSSFTAEADTTKLYISALYLDADTTYSIFYSIAGNRNDNVTGSGNNNILGKFKIAKDGYDANTQTDIRRFNFVSGYNVPKIDLAKSGSVTETLNKYPDTTIITIPHNLGYVPVAFVMYENLGKMLPYTVPLVGGDFMLFYINSTNLVIEARSDSEPISATFKYKILRDKIA